MKALCLSEDGMRSLRSHGSAANLRTSALSQAVVDTINALTRTSSPKPCPCKTSPALLQVPGFPSLSNEALPVLHIVTLHPVPVTRLGYLAGWLSRRRRVLVHQPLLPATREGLAEAKYEIQRGVVIAGAVRTI